MPRNSFRLFVVSLHDGQMREPEPFEKAQPRRVRSADDDGSPVWLERDPVNYPEEIAIDVESRGGVAFVFGRKKIEDDDDEVTEFGGHVIRWKKAKRTDTTTRMWFEAGPVTTEGTLVDPDGVIPDLDLGRDIRATLHPFRAVLTTKPGKTYGLLAVEARGQRCPRDELVRALRDSSAQRWSLRISHGAAAKAAVLDFIKDANINAVTFTEYGFGRARNRKAPQLKRLRVDEIIGGLDQVRTAVREWITKKQVGGAAAAQNLLGLVVTEQVGIPFNDVAVELEDDKQQRSFRPSSDYRQFRYSLGKEIVNDQKFFADAEKAAWAILDDVQAIAEQAGDSVGIED